MARYFLDLHEDGTVLRDVDGIEADSIETVRTLALAAARDIMCGDLSHGSLCLSCCIEIRDDAHAVLERVNFRDAVRITGL